MHANGKGRSGVARLASVAAISLSAVALLLIIAATLVRAAENRTGGTGRSPRTRVAMRQPAYPGKVITALPFDRRYFQGYANQFQQQLPQGRNPREFRVIFYDSARNLQAGVDVALFNTWQEAQRAITTDAGRSTIAYTVTPTDAQLGIGDLVILAWDGRVDNAARADESRIRGISFTRNNVGVISHFENAENPGNFVKLIRAMDKTLISALVDIRAPQRGPQEPDDQQDNRRDEEEDEDEEDEEEEEEEEGD